MKWLIDNNVAAKYLEKCALFIENDDEFRNFKRDEDYNKILEGNEYEVGKIALESIKLMDSFTWFLLNQDRFRENEGIGNPVRRNYDGLDIAPSTLRYANSLLEIKQLLGDFQPKSIIEIGGGYGGLCKTMSLFYDFDSYLFIDLPIVNKLCAKYLSNFPFCSKTNYISCYEPIGGRFDLFIADSSLSECDLETQLKYIQVAKRCQYIYIVYNTFHLPEGKANFNRLMKELSGFQIYPKMINNVGILYIKRK